MIQHSNLQHRVLIRPLVPQAEQLPRLLSGPEPQPHLGHVQVGLEVEGVLDVAVGLQGNRQGGLAAVGAVVAGGAAAPGLSHTAHALPVGGTLHGARPWAPCLAG